MREEPDFGQFVCVTCGSYSDAHAKDGAGECRDCSEAALANKLVIFGGHPRDIDLRDFAARPYGEAKAAEMEAHIERCSRCRLSYHRIMVSLGKQMGDLS